MSWRKLVANRHVLIVEDEESIRVGVAEALRAAGYEVLQASDGISGLATARRPGIRIVLLDLMLPKLDGMSVLKQLRQSHPTPTRMDSSSSTISTCLLATSFLQLMALYVLGLSLPN